MPGGPVGSGAPGLGQTQQRYYTAKDLANLGREVGWRDDRPSNDPGQRHSELAVAVAIALAESGGDSQAINTASGATGLWQIYPGGDQYLDADNNARTAFSKYEGAGNRFTPWSAFTNKAYLVKLPIAEAAVKGTHRDRPAFTGGGTGAIHDLIAFTGNIGHDLANFFGWITSGATWIRLGEVLAGAVLVLLAMLFLGKALFDKTETGKQAKTILSKGML